MYLARLTQHGRTRYLIRESYFDGFCFRSRDLMDLGGSPADYIIYPGGNAYYIHECVEDRLSDLGIRCDDEALDGLFWPFIEPRIRRIVESFSRKTKTRPLEIDTDPGVKGAFAHIFDKRRLHYLRFGRMDQGNIHRFPAKLVSVLENKSRDEKEQYFLDAEQILRPQEMKNYVFTAFDLQRHFYKSYAKNHPGMLDILELDEYFLDNLCDLNQDETFWKGFDKNQGLEMYLVRYVVMFFDFEFGSSSFLQDYIKSFMDSRRSFRFASVTESFRWEEASNRFQMEKSTLKRMTRRELTVRYRKLALKAHPDQGGDHEAFIKLTRAYREILRRKPE